MKGFALKIVNLFQKYENITKTRRIFNNLLEDTKFRVSIIFY